MLNKCFIPTTRLFVYQLLFFLTTFFGNALSALAQQSVSINDGESEAIFCANLGGEINSFVNTPCGSNGISYQWEILENDNTWDFIDEDTGSGIFTGYNDRTLTLTSNSPTELLSFDGSSVRLTIDYTCENAEGALNSNSVTLDIVEATAPPTPSATPSGAVCPGTMVTLSVQNDGLGGVFIWSKGGMSIGTGNSIQVTPSQTTNYNVRRQVDECLSSSRGIQVLVGSTVSALTNVQSNVTQPCAGQNIRLTASGGIGASSTIKWYSAPNGGGELLFTGAVFQIASATNSTFYIRRENGCGSVTEDYIYSITTQDTPSAAIVNLPQTLCVGIPFEFQANTTGNPGNTNYSWTFTGGSPSTSTGAGPIEVTYNRANSNRTIVLTAKPTNNSSCQSTFTHTFSVIAQPSLSINNIPVSSTSHTDFDVAANTTANLVLTSNITDAVFEWSFKVKEGSIEGPPGAGQGAVINEKWTLPDGVEKAELEGTVIVSSGSCTETYQIRIFLQQLLFIPNVLTANGDGHNDCWAINLLEGNSFTREDFAIELYSRSGKCARGCGESFTLADAIKWCGEGCPSGAYFYKITGPEGYENLGSLTIVK